MAGVGLPRPPPAPATQTRARRSRSGARAVPWVPSHRCHFRDKRGKKTPVTATQPALSSRLGPHLKMPSWPHEREDQTAAGQQPAGATRRRSLTRVTWAPGLRPR